jgi:hypothetical protein
MTNILRKRWKSKEDEYPALRDTGLAKAFFIKYYTGSRHKSNVISFTSIRK